MIALGAMVLEFAAYELIGTGLVEKAHQKNLRREFQAALDNPVVAPSGSSPNRIASTRAIANLRIAKISVDVIVVEGVKLADLVFGPGRYPSSAQFGGAGSVAVAGHRTGWGSPFLNVDRLVPGDQILITTITGMRYTYSVTRSVVVGSGEGNVLKGNPNSSARSQLTLTTCTPKYTSQHRLIVWADQIGTGGSA